MTLLGNIWRSQDFLLGITRLAMGTGSELFDDQSGAANGVAASGIVTTIAGVPMRQHDITAI
jgi:hypothetical protein